MRLYFPSSGTLGCSVWPGAGISHSPGVPPGFYVPHVNVGLPVPWATTTASLQPPHYCNTTSTPPQLCPSCMNTRLDEYLFFKSLVVRPPYSSIFWQFWLFFKVSCDPSYGCARRQSMSTYTSILARGPNSCLILKCVNESINWYRYMHMYENTSDEVCWSP